MTLLFRLAAAYGLIALLPMYFQAPADLTHPEFYFGFILSHTNFASTSLVGFSRPGTSFK